MTASPLSQPTHEIQVEHGVPVPMRDGTILRADVYRPRDEGRFPVLVERVAYELTRRCKANAEYYASRGYVFVGQNVRGKYGSEGAFRVGFDDGWGANQDGYDTVEWIAAQPWSNGAVGTVDGSYSGMTQYLLAPTRPPHLKAMFVRQGIGDVYRDFFFRGGTLQMTMAQMWAMRQTLLTLEHETAPPGMEAERDRLAKAVEDLEAWYSHLPLKSLPPLAGLSDWYSEVLDNPSDGPYWWPVSLSLRFQDVDTPILHLGSWFDALLGSTLRCFVGIQRKGRTEACRTGQRLVIGPWLHGRIGRREVGEMDFGPEAEFDLPEFRLRWFDHWMKGVETGAMDGPPVRIFLMGENRWLDLDAWPPPGVSYEPVYLREGTGPSADSLNNGLLTSARPRAAERPDAFVYDPEDPVESQIRYPELGPRDHRDVEGRLLTYTSQALERDLPVVGPIRAVLYGLSSAPDTDWVVRLCDVWPDGRSMSVSDGILRGRYRNSLEIPELMSPNHVYRFEVEMGATAQVFKAGHRLRVHVTSSDFPRYDKNLNTGGPFGEEVRGQVAVNTVFHDALRESCLILPVMVEDASSG
ncbi:MAG: CocE/NonD family hydrolase [Candidatus Latescibacteria bacterium]|jgi:hypothetical protein|nr:CocE/NonD family hydrolase [Candidatus Latescibacterota bacterium]